MARVEVRVIERKKWHGKKGKDSFARPTSTEVLLDPITGRYATGLDGLKPEELERLSRELGGVDLSSIYSFEQPHPFWSSKTGAIKLPDHTTVYNTDRALDFVKVCNLKGSKLVANSMKEYDDSLWPHATHYIFDENEEIDRKATTAQKKARCWELVGNMTRDEKVNVIQMLSDVPVRLQSDNYLTVKLDELINEQTKDFLIWASRDKEDVYLRAIITEAAFGGIVMKGSDGYSFMGENMGYNLDDVVEYIRDPEHQVLKATIIKKLATRL